MDRPTPFLVLSSFYQRRIGRFGPTGRSLRDMAPCAERGEEVRIRRADRHSHASQRRSRDAQEDEAKLVGLRGFVGVRGSGLPGGEVGGQALYRSSGRWPGSRGSWRSRSASSANAGSGEFRIVPAAGAAARRGSPAVGRRREATRVPARVWEWRSSPGSANPPAMLRASALSDLRMRVV
jgi:hypothetical protein